MKALLFDGSLKSTILLALAWLAATILRLSSADLRHRIWAYALPGIALISIPWPQNVRVLKGLGYGLDDFALEAVQRWKFKPGERGGKSVAVQAVVEINFRLT